MGFWDMIWGESEKTYTKAEIEHLLEKIKRFNAGAIDKYLSEHVDKVYHMWLLDNEDE